MRVVLVAGFDSGLKFASRLADAVEAQGGQAELWAPADARRRLSEGQVRAMTARPVATGEWDELVREAAAADAVVPVLDGPRVERFVRDVHGVVSGRSRNDQSATEMGTTGDGTTELGTTEQGTAEPGTADLATAEQGTTEQGTTGRHGTGRMPVVGAGYVGMALYDLVGGYLMRSLADVVAVNSRSDLRLFSSAAAALGLPQEALLLTGLSLLPAAPVASRGGPIHTVLFTDQPTVPRSEADRILLWDRVLGYAQHHPDRTVLLKPRHKPGEDTFHTMRVSPESWAATRTLPPNLRIDHTPVEQAVTTADLLITVSSTAALEAIAHGTRVAFVADRVDDASLNPPLLPSGLLRRFDAIDADDIGEPDPAWLDDVFPAAHGEAPAARFARRLREVVEGAAPRTHQDAWDSAMHRGRREDEVRRSVVRLPPGRRFAPRRVAAGALRRALRLVDR